LDGSKKYTGKFDERNATKTCTWKFPRVIVFPWIACPKFSKKCWNRSCESQYLWIVYLFSVRLLPTVPSRTSYEIE
jgi:hypothetical protein